MGLVQREIERAGIPTVSISNVPETTERVCVSRAVFIQYPFGRLLGDVGDREGQRRVCDDILDWLVRARGPNAYRHLLHEWPESPERAKWRPDVPPPLALARQGQPPESVEDGLKRYHDHERE